MVKTADARLPRGTKVVARAFFAAADEIKEEHRPAVVKAALALIRDELREQQVKVRGRKPVVVKAMPPKAPVKRGRKPAAKVATEAEAAD
jgi:hypothetical protein